MVGVSMINVPSGRQKIGKENTNKEVILYSNIGIVMTENDEKKSRFGRRKFIGHVVRDDPDIDKESTRPIEKRRLISTDVYAIVSEKRVPKTKLTEINVDIKRKEPDKIHKPLHQKIYWKTLKKEIDLEENRRKIKRESK